MELNYSINSFGSKDGGKASPNPIFSSNLLRQKGVECFISQESNNNIDFVFTLYLKWWHMRYLSNY